MPTIWARDVATVTLKIPIPITAVKDDVTEWLKFNLLRNGGIDCNNPLMSLEPAPSDIKIFYSSLDAI